MNTLFYPSRSHNIHIGKTLFTHTFQQPVTNDLYYVPAESVVCKVVSKNWVSLKISHFCCRKHGYAHTFLNFPLT